MVPLEQRNCTSKSHPFRRKETIQNLLVSFQICMEQGSPTAWTAHQQAPVLLWSILCLVHSHLYYSACARTTSVPISTKADPSKQPLYLQILSTESRHSKACQVCSIYLIIRNGENSLCSLDERLPSNGYSAIRTTDLYLEELFSCFLVPGCKKCGGKRPSLTVTPQHTQGY